MGVTHEQVRGLIQEVERADSAVKLIKAVEALVESRHESAITTLIQVLSYNNPGAAVAAVDGLIDIGEPAVPYILENLDGYNYGARAWATRALAGIGDPRALELLLEAAISDFSLSVRRAAARGLGNIIWAKLPEDERLSASETVMNTLFQVSNDHEWVVRYAAVVGLQTLAFSSLTSQSSLFNSILLRFEEMLQQDPEIAIRARTQMALEKLKSPSG